MASCIKSWMVESWTSVWAARGLKGESYKIEMPRTQDHKQKMEITWQARTWHTDTDALHCRAQWQMDVTPPWPMALNPQLSFFRSNAATWHPQHAASAYIEVKFANTLWANFFSIQAQACSPRNLIIKLAFQHETQFSFDQAGYLNLTSYNCMGIYNNYNIQIKLCYCKILYYQSEHIEYAFYI